MLSHVEIGSNYWKFCRTLSEKCKPFFLPLVVIDVYDEPELEPELTMSMTP